MVELVSGMAIFGRCFADVSLLRGCSDVRCGLPFALRAVFMLWGSIMVTTRPGSPFEAAAVVSTSGVAVGDQDRRRYRQVCCRISGKFSQQALGYHNVIGDTGN
ncbi:hypothetical protein FZI85_14410 [Mycobacterium sp. CBMA293]|uniref:hypothetical protein n=1 Tax=unclassified Mycolicibacterium TaxID=2636767 RepID=UPI0012DCBCE8|nr:MULTISPECIES: hypothetical protein [unclassified Mycolicibacterium]MUL48215.1 hypothetical protein [Mycolicibacterium sp. CBMA 360]MUL57616.1 hypothetical protein [Mycolicibacterium sp. CBMA 335]MUL70656.1 hypothetical protein [Mycolicibacterium sp. CBMA 311]MUL92704.1 hypothetical protein [Mycolicibacterium sp. CBMA 230]MUM12213.1 hypothetical protein [Mycolicibacterium sp. CBMA 293]